MKNETAKWTVFTKIEKYKNSEDFKKGLVDSVQKIKGNMLLSEGINALWGFLCGDVANTYFDNTNAHFGVGDSTTDEGSAQTGLQATTNLIYRPMDTGYPSFGTDGKVVFKATFGETLANFSWNEWSIANGADQTTAINLNRKVESMGTKPSGATWVITVEISLT